MTEEERLVEEGFYREVARVLGCDNHVYRPFPYPKRTRWNNRAPGNGRYIGYGIVRRYSKTKIHVMLKQPYLIGVYDSDEQALFAISVAISNLATNNYY
jgi:hypothetical protein